MTFVRRRLAPFFAAWLVASSVIGCGASTPSPTSNAVTDASLPGFGPSEPGAGEGGALVSNVSGRFLDASGAPPAVGFGASVCGPVCYLSQTDASGAFSVHIGSSIDLPQFSALPHGRPYVAGFYFALPLVASGPSIDLGDLRIISMPHDGAPIDLTGASAQTLTSGPATLHVDAGVTTKLEFDDFAAGAAGAEFRAVAVDPAVMGRFVPADASELVALGPFESYALAATGAVVPSRVTLDNLAHLAPGTRVEFLALGTYLHPEWIAPAVFTRVATGSVSSDDASIEPDPGAGVLYLTWIAVRPIATE